MTSPAMARIAKDILRAEARLDFPRYRQIIDALIHAIEGGTLHPGDRLPPETTMAKLFSVSLGTVQKALAHLADIGFLQRTRRRGTFVTGRQAEDVFVFRFRNADTGKVMIPFTRVLSVSEVRSDRAWRGFLNAARCVRVERLVWVEGDSPAFSEFYIASEHGLHLLNEPLENLHGVSFHRILGRNFNLPTLRTNHRLQCRSLSAAACDRLLVPEGTFGTVWDVVGYSYQQATTFQSLQIPAGHRPIEFDMAAEFPQSIQTTGR
ncbi:MAG: GntR family transcriptional regulator [Proteobacteria bacterium]|nr:GntR family transcriptional regulator [Pseudomonadota bacterium]